VLLRFELSITNVSSFQVLLSAIFYFFLNRKRKFVRKLDKILLVNCFIVLSSGMLHG